MRVPDSFNKVYATEGQLREAKQEIKELENMLKEDERRKRPYIQDPAEVRAEIIKKKKFVEEFEPKKITGKTSNKLYAEAKQIAQEIKEAMPPAKAYFQRYAKDSDGHKKQRDFDNAVRQQIAFQTNKDLQKKIIRYKAIMASLDPQDHSVRNIEALRRQR